MAAGRIQTTFTGWAGPASVQSPPVHPFVIFTLYSLFWSAGGLLPSSAHPPSLKGAVMDGNELLQWLAWILLFLMFLVHCIGPHKH